MTWTRQTHRKNALNVVRGMVLSEVPRPTTSRPKYITRIRSWQRHDPTMKMKILFIALLFIASTSHAQHRKAVSAKEVNGTYHDCFGKYCNEIKFLAIGNNKLKVSFEGYYPWANEEGANIGFTSGEARIDADSAIFSRKEEYADEDCRIVIRFKKPGVIEVEHVTSSVNCGFGNNVMMDGTYKKVSAKKPKIKEKEDEE
jgi:hypothetical protein